MHMTVNKTLLQEYVASEKVFKRAEDKLARSLESELKRLIKAKDIDGIEYMIDQLPRSFKPVRRLYEALLEIHGVK